MQHGKPSVVTSAGGSIEAARPEREALVFESGNPASLASNLERLIGDSHLRNTLGEAARSRAQSYLTIERCAADYNILYSSIIATQVNKT
jgi:glycosyltransferase involved in cell wall biosynthesis